MAVLVTGGAGFLGSHLLERLLDDTDEQLVCLDNFNDFYSPGRKRQNLGRLAASPRFHLVEGDLVDPAVVEGVFRRFSIAQVFHAAALAGIRPSVEDPLPYLKTNVEGTLALLETVRRYGVDRLVFVSSSSVYGNECAVPFREDAPLGRPASPYGVTKHAAEQLCLLYHTLHGMPVVVVRPFSVYGPRLRPDLALSVFARCIDQGRPLPLLGDGSQKRDFTYVGDVVNGLLAASRRDCVGEVINLGHNKPVAICRLIALLEQELGKPARIEPQPAHPGDLSVTCADLSKAIRLLGYRPQVSIEDGVREFVAWFRSRG
jgi:UDP-glucuronate 4-epimerase